MKGIGGLHDCLKCGNYYSRQSQERGLVLVHLGCYDKISSLGVFQTVNILTVLEAGKSKIKLLSDSVPGDGPASLTAVVLP